MRPSACRHEAFRAFHAKRSIDDRAQNFVVAHGWFGRSVRLLQRLFNVAQNKSATTIMCSRHSATDQRSSAGLNCSWARQRFRVEHTKFSRVSAK